MCKDPLTYGIRAVPTITLFVVFSLIASSEAVGSLASLCIFEPPLRLVAGESYVQATDHDPPNWDCSAAIHFSNPAFPPIAYPYQAGLCQGPANTSFLVPIGVPNGEAFITWTCGAMTSTCIRAIISDGRGDLQQAAALEGALECEMPLDCSQTTYSSGHESRTDFTNSNDSYSTLPPAVSSDSTSSASVPPTTSGSVVPDQSQPPPASSILTSRDSSSIPPPTTSEFSSSVSVPPTTLGSTVSDQSQPPPPSSDLTSLEQSDSSSDFAQLSSASRVSTPSIAQSLLTVTRTVTTLLTTTFTASAAR